MDLIRYLLSTVFVFFASCGPGDGKGEGPAPGDRDSIQIYYGMVRDRDLSLRERSKAANRALAFCKDRDSILGYLLYQKNHLHLSSGEYDSLVHYHGRFKAMDSLLDDDYNKARQFYLMGYYYREIAKDFEQAYLNFRDARAHYEKLGDSSAVGRILLYMGTIEKDQNDFFGSKETLTDALRYLKSPGDDPNIALCYNLLATNHRKLANFGDAVTYYNQAMALAGSDRERRSFENNLAAAYLDEGRYGNAIKILDRIIGDSALDRTSGQYARILDNLSYARWLSGEPVGEEPFLLALKIRKAKKDGRGQIASYTHLGEYHSDSRPELAIKYFDSVISLSRSLKIPKAESDVLRLLMPLEPEQVALRDRYIALQDSLDREGLKVKTQFAKYKYDNTLTRESLLELEKENAEAALKASRTKNQVVIGIFSILLVLLAVGFLWYRSQQKARRLAQENKTARLEASMETEAGLSRRLHDEFGAGLNQAMLMVQGNKEGPKLLDLLDRLYRMSRNISRELNEVDTGPRFKAEFMEMLRSRTPEGTKLFLFGNAKLDWDAMAPLSKEVLFKVLMELMINMGRHSHAKMVVIDFKTESGLLGVDYSDNGKGATEGELALKNGLKNTEKRIRAIGGTIIFESAKGKGFKASMTFPF